ATLMTSSRPDSVHPSDPADGLSGEPLTESDAEEHIHGICFKTGPPGKVGVELEWLVRDGHDPNLPVDQQRVATPPARPGPPPAGRGGPGGVAGAGRPPAGPGGKVEIIPAPADGLGPCVDPPCRDLTTLRQAVLPAGLRLTGQGLDPLRSPRRVLDVPRYAAM